MTTACPRRNNVMQFLEVSENCRVTRLESSTFLKKSYFNFALNVLFLKELKSAILSQNLRRFQGGGPWGSGPLNRNATNDKNLTKKPCFFVFSFLWHLCVQQYTRTTAINNK